MSRSTPNLPEAAKQFLELTESLLDWMNGNDSARDHFEDRPEEFAAISDAMVDLRYALSGGKSDDPQTLTCPCGTPIIRDGIVVKSHWVGSICQDCEAVIFEKNAERFKRAWERDGRDDPPGTTPSMAKWP